MLFAEVYAFTSLLGAKFQLAKRPSVYESKFCPRTHVHSAIAVVHYVRVLYSVSDYCTRFGVRETEAVAFVFGHIATIENVPTSSIHEDAVINVVKSNQGI